MKLRSMKFRKAIAGILCIIIFIMSTGCSSVVSDPVQQVIDAINSSEYSTANEIYYEKISGNLSLENEVKAQLTKIISNAIESYNNGEMTYDEAVLILDVIERADIYSYSSLSSSYTELENLQTSKNYYEQAVALEESGEYLDAIECLEQIPPESDLYSDAQDMIEKSTQEYKATVIEKVEAYLDSENYVAAISLVESALTVLEDDDDLEKLYQDAVRSDVLASAEVYIQEGDLVTALSIIEDGLEKLPTDIELQDKYAEVFSEYRDVICQDAITAAKDYVEADGDYPSAITVLNKALDTIGDDTEVNAKLTSYKNAYREKMIEAAAEKFNTSGYEQAIAVLRDALSVLENDPELLSLIEEYETYAPVDVKSLTLLSNYDYLFSLVDSDYTVDSYGNTYTSGYYIIMGSDGGTVASYRLGGEYSVCSGGVAYSQKQKYGITLHGSIQFYDENGTLLYSTGNLDYDTKYFEFSFSVEGVEKLIIKTSGTNTANYALIPYLEVVK